MSQCTSLLKGTARQAHTENCRRRIEEKLRGTAKAEAAQRRAKEHQGKAAERSEANEVEPRGRTTARTRRDDGPVQTTVAPHQEQAALGREVDRTGWTTRGRQRVNKHKEGPEREDGKWVRSGETSGRQSMKTKRAC